MCFTDRVWGHGHGNSRSSHILWCAWVLVVWLISGLCSVQAEGGQPGTSAGALKTDRILFLDAVRIGDRTITVGERGKIFLSDDNGESWREAPTPATETLTAVHFFDAEHGWAVGHRGLALRTEDGGLTWQRGTLDMDFDNSMFDVWFRTPNDGLALSMFGQIFVTEDGGRTWQSRFAVNEEEELDAHLYSITSLNDGTLFIAGEMGTLLRSQDGGETWELLESPYVGSYFGIIHGIDDRLIAFGLRGNAWRSDDRGKSWEKIELGGGFMPLQSGALWPNDRIVLTGGSGFIAFSDDNGMTFHRVNTGTRAGFAKALPDEGGKSALMFGMTGIRKYSLNEVD